MRNTKEKTVKDYAVKSLIAAIAAAGIALGAAFTSPDDMFNKDAFVPQPFEISDCMLYDNDTDSDDAVNNIAEEKRQKGFRAAIRRLFMNMPIGARAFLGVPVWVIGRVLLAALGALVNSVLSPLLIIVLKYLCIAGLILAAVTMSVKAVMPEIPLNKIVTGKRIAISAVVSVLFGLCGVLVNFFYPEGTRIYELVESGLITLMLILAASGFLKIKKRKEKQMV